METNDAHQELGRLIRERRKVRGWTLENVSTQVRRLGLRLSPQHLSNIENAYNHPGKEPSTPPDDLLRALSRVLEIPLSDLHASLGRIPANDAAAALVREKLAGYELLDDMQLSPSEVDDMASDLGALAESLVSSRVKRFQRQSQSQQGSGKQAQRQKQGVA